MKNVNLEISSAPLFDTPGDLGRGDVPLTLYMPRRTGGTTFEQSDSPQEGPTADRGQRLSPQRIYRHFGKPILDLMFLIAALPVTLPIVLLCAAALWFEGGHPFYRQARLGKDGRIFWIVKLRTMVRDADQLLEQYLNDDPALAEEWRTTQKLRNDPRVTRLGAVLRATSLDELPQLWNVLKGEMSIVGPRPMLPEQLPLYGDPEPYFALRPGLTGLWQVSVRNETEFSDRARLDAAYYADLSCRFDMALLLRTVGVVLRRTGY